MNPIYVDPFLGAGAVWLSLLGSDLVPPVSWMGGKRRLAREILALLDLHPGRPGPCILGDASWWGWVWPTCLDPVTAAGLAVLARMARGGLLHAEPCHGRGVVKRWEGPYTADVLGEGATEVEALAAVILRGGE